MRADVIVDGIKDVLKAKGFKKKGLNWFIESDECVCILNVQHPPFSEMFYINLAVHAKVLDPTLRPQYYECKLMFRLNEIVPNEREPRLDEIIPNPHGYNEIRPDPHQHKLDRCLNFYGRNEDEIRIRVCILRECIELYAIPFLCQCVTVEGLNSAIFDHHLQLWVKRRLKELLHIPWA